MKELYTVMLGKYAAAYVEEDSPEKAIAFASVLTEIDASKLTVEEPTEFERKVFELGVKTVGDGPGSGARMAGFPVGWRGF